MLVWCEGTARRSVYPGDIDGTLGEVYAGEIKTAASEIVQVLVEKSLNPGDSRTYQYFAQLMKERTV